MSAEQAIMTHAELVQTIASACQKALKAGLTRDNVKAVLERLTEVLDGADDE
jgi:hypothetical protein